MGIVISDCTTADVLYQLNHRFSDAGPLQEMVVIQKEFGLFSEKYSLKQAFRTLHIVPAEFHDRRFWYLFLDELKNYVSDLDGVSGHDRIVKAYKDNLEGDEPLPVHTTTHRFADDKRVTVTCGQPVIYETQEYLIISIPTIPAKETDRAARVAARKKAAA